VSGLVCAYVLGPRLNYGREPFEPYNLALTMTGAGMLWVGWFGFNAGSAVAADGRAGLAMVATHIAASAGALTWMLGEWIMRGRPSLLGLCSGLVAGLVAITPAAGFVTPRSALLIGAVAGLACYWGATGLKRLLRADDSLDVFGVHGVGGILGALLTGVFAAPQLGGQGVWDYIANKASPDYSIAKQLLVQAEAVGVTIVWSALVAFIAFKLVDVVIGLRVPADAEREGLDITSHGESAYHL
jgi:Amt family ammonium transporter